MSDIVIRAENLGKSYLIGHEKQERYTVLRDVLANKAKQIIRKTGQIFSGGQLIAGNEIEEFWALKDINFELKQGERLGIIGRNGAGKSTLLKVLSRITEPTTGRIQIKGRVASLLEVGTGFHPELSGRENIYLNGAILGMSRLEIKKKFDEIVDFSGVENFLDTPVKRYSSGMYVRLAFAVAAHLEPEILIVDEVLSVGDAEFQKKCLGKMEDVSTKEGRTVLFVSHNMTAVQNLCTKIITLQNGGITNSGNSSEVIANYMNSMQRNITLEPVKSGFAKLNIYMEDFRGDRRDVINIGETVRFIILLSVDTPLQKAEIGIGIVDIMGNRVVTHHTMFQHTESWGVKKSVKISVTWQELILLHGYYRFEVALFAGQQMVAGWDEIGGFSVVETDYFGTGKLPDPMVQGRIATKAIWHIEEQNV